MTPFLAALERGNCVSTMFCPVNDVVFQLTFIVWLVTFSSVPFSEGSSYILSFWFQYQIVSSDSISSSLLENHCRLLHSYFHWMISMAFLSVLLIKFFELIVVFFYLLIINVFNFFFIDSLTTLLRLGSYFVCMQLYFLT